MSGARVLNEKSLSEAVIAVICPATDRRGATPTLTLRRLQGGYSGITYLADLEVGGGVRQLVVKVAPPGLSPVRNRDVLRQAAVIGALAEVGFPVPRLLCTSPGDGDVPPFYVTEFVAGDAYEPIFDGPGRASDQEIRSRSLRASALLARLHQLDVGMLAVEPGPEVTLSDEVERWQRAFASVPPDLQFGGPELGRALAGGIPDAVATVLVHGDFRLGNMIAAGDRICAVLDWEIWSRSDPRIDLVWFATQADAGSHPAATWQPPGMPSPEALVTAYEGERGVTVGDLSWFSSLVRFKVAATSALIVKHARAQPVPDPDRLKWQPGIAPLIRDGLRLLGRAA